MDKTAIILAGGFSRRFGLDKGLLEIENKPLILHVVDSISSLVQELIIVTNSEKRIEIYSKKILNPKVKFTLDLYDDRGPLAGALTGLSYATGKYSLLVPFDAPFMSKKILLLLFRLCKNRSAVIPKWPNNHIEPLHAVYNTKEAFKAATNAIAQQETKVRAIIKRLNNVHYVSTKYIQKYDSNLQTFLNINTPSDLIEAKNILKPLKIS